MPSPYILLLLSRITSPCITPPHAPPTPPATRIRMPPNTTQPPQASHCTLTWSRFVSSMPSRTRYVITIIPTPAIVRGCGVTKAIWRCRTGNSTCTATPATRPSTLTCAKCLVSTTRWTTQSTRQKLVGLR